jgi:hypothetical protein
MAHLISLVLLVLQTQASSTELGYRFTVPGGFAPFPDGRSQPDIVDCWAEDPTSTGGGIILCVQRLHGVLPREAMRQQDVPAGTQLATFKWKGFDIQGLSSQTARGADSIFVLVAQVPLRREAVQLFFSGPVGEGSRGQSLMEATLASLEGETNWLSASDRAGRLGTIAGWWIGIAVAVVGVLVWRKRRSQVRA